MSRLKIIGVFVVLLFFTLVGGLFNLTVIEGGRNRQLSNKNSIRLIPQVGARGKILDRNNEIIVTSQLVYDVMVMPQPANQLAQVFVAVARFLETTPDNLAVSYRKNFVSPSLPVPLVKNVTLKKAIIVEELKLEVPGLSVVARPGRCYPYGDLGCHFIGYLGEIDRWRLTNLKDYGYKTKDIVGFGGVEDKYDYYLRQDEGGLSVQVDHRGRFIKVLGFRPPENGIDIQLTINLKIQKAAEEALGDRRGAVVIMDPFTGEIIAMVSSPRFSPADFINRNGPAISGYFRNPSAPLLNRAIGSACPPGSIFKLMTVATALELKKIDLNTTTVCPGFLMVGRRRFRCWDTHGSQSTIPAIAHSCDVFFYKTGFLLGPQQIHDYVIKFGMSKQTGFELLGEVSGFIPSPRWRGINKFRPWSDGDTANFSIGQGDVLTTPLQLVCMVSVFANKGYLVHPYIVKAIGNRDISATQRRYVRVPIKEGALETVRRGMREVVAGVRGTASILANLPVEIAGKTGTAEVPPKPSHGWFVGYFPYKNPKYAVCVFVENGGHGYLAASLLKRIVEVMKTEKLI